MSEISEVDRGILSELGHDPEHLYSFCEDRLRMVYEPYESIRTDGRTYRGRLRNTKIFHVLVPIDRRRGVIQYLGVLATSQKNWWDGREIDVHYMRDENGLGRSGSNYFRNLKYYAEHRIYCDYPYSHLLFLESGVDGLCGTCRSVCRRSGLEECVFYEERE